MSSGKIHNKLTCQIKLPISVILAIGIFFIVGWTGSLISFGLLWIGFSLQQFMTPDLDVDTGFYGFFLIRKKFGRLAYYLWRGYWYLYAKIMPHRGFWSHFPVISSLVRLAYLFIPIWVLGYFFLDYNFLDYWDWWLYLFIGVIIADLGHIFLDYVSWFEKWYQSTIAKNEN